MRKLVLFVLILSLYIFLDNLGFQNYGMMISAFGIMTFILTMSFNLLLSVFSALTIDLALSSQSSRAIGVGLGNAIAAFFAGCTSCGISIIAIIGLNVTLPVVTPGAIEFKMLAFIFIILSYYYTKHKIEKGCKLK